jgi:hypothetical protein
VDLLGCMWFEKLALIFTGASVFRRPQTRGDVFPVG